MENNSLTPEQKAAAVIVSLGAEKASKVYKHLSESEIEKLTIEVAKLGHAQREADQSGRVCGKDGERFSGCDQDRGIHVEETV